MKVGLYKNETDSAEMSNEYLEFEYQNLISDQATANAVKAMILKLEIDRRQNEILEQEKKSLGDYMAREQD